ncbi:MAG: DNA-3-methyladenine glycosylase [Scrofimicrobium sp.]
MSSDLFQGSLVLPHSFYERETLEVARDLIGCHLHRKLPEELGGEILVGQITETEGYLGEFDDAAHTARGRTKRNQVMFGPPGFTYVYFIYGMHWNLNVVTMPEGIGQGVLIRGVVPIQGEETMAKLRGRPKPLADGPGKLCQAFAITGDDYGTDLTGDQIFITERTSQVNVRTTPRIGIDYATSKHEPWRFIDSDRVRR